MTHDFKTPWRRPSRSLAAAAFVATLATPAWAATVSVDFGLAGPLVIDEGQSITVSLASQYQAGSSYQTFDPYHSYCFFGGCSYAYVYGYGTSAGRTQGMTFYRSTQDYADGALHSQMISTAQGQSVAAGSLQLLYADEGADTVYGSSRYQYLRQQWGRDCQSSWSTVVNGVRDAWCTTLRDYNDTVWAFMTGYAQLSVQVRNVAPTITELTGPLQVTEGQHFALNALATDPGVNDVLTYRWDLNNDGVFGDAVGSGVEWSFIGAGSRTVTVEVSDGDGGVTRLATTVEVAAVPLPGSLPLLAAGGFAAIGMRRRRMVAA